MVETITNYLLSEQLLGLSAGLLGLASIFFGIVFLFFLPQFKAFAITMMVLGTVEAGVFITGYYVSSDRIEEKIEQYRSNPNTYVTKEIVFSKGRLQAFFLIKLAYASLILILSITLSKANLSPVFAGILTALIIHLALAITIDNFGERYTKNIIRY